MSCHINQKNQFVSCLNTKSEDKNRFQLGFCILRDLVHKQTSITQIVTTTISNSGKKKKRWLEFYFILFFLL